MRVAAVVAHPDDEVLGLGATLARHVASGDDVRAFVLADGATSRYPDEMQAELQRMACKSADQLGLSEISFGGLPDQRLDALPLIEVVRVVEGFLQSLQPAVVYTHFSDDVNLDHAVVARATWTVCRPYQLPCVRRVLSFETPSSTEWGWPGVRHAFDPNVFTDVSDFLELKLAAMRCYDSELRDLPHPRSLRMLQTRAEYWGSIVGVGAAEPFLLLRDIS